MRKFLLISILFIGCKGVFKPSIDKEKAKEVVRAYILQTKLLAKIDSLVIDTSFVYSPKTDSFIVRISLESLLNTDSTFYLRYSYDSLQKEKKRYDQQVKGPYGFYLISLQEYNDNTIREYDIAKKRDSGYRQRLDLIKNNINKIDSSTNKGWYVHYSAMGADTLNKQDYASSYILLSTNYRILEDPRDDIIKHSIIN